ncbi:hypothetical protein D1AOALGA4SA_8881 [Olavius algarvensis Delta 1 endosymbiont]|nr:hypothetical protein D1AOALGA4SA_8881 [Olavius algarvensis Delta 1 endosymbiont]
MIEITLACRNLEPQVFSMVSRQLSRGFVARNFRALIDRFGRRPA